MSHPDPSSRRSFLQTTALVGGGLLAGFYLPTASRFGNAMAATSNALQPNVFVLQTIGSL
jgi:hypothetical protein